MPALPPNNQRPVLKARLDLSDAVLVGLGSIVGGGVFAALGTATDLAGPGMLLALALAGVVALINGLASASLASAFPEAGGVYVYAGRLLHPLVGYLAGWLFLASKIASAAAIAGAFSAYAAPQASPALARAAAAALVAALTLLNVAGVRASLRVNTVLVALKLASLAFFVGLALPVADSANFRPFLPHGWDGVGRAAAVLFFAYTGYARLSSIAEEVREPETTIARAIVLSVVLSVVLYALVAAAALGAAGVLFSGHSLTTRSQNNAPLLVAAAFTGHPAARWVVTFGAVVACVSILLTLLWGLSRVVFAMARNGDLPPALSALLPEQHTPWLALLLVGGLSAALAATGNVPALIAASAFSILIYYALANVCALVLNRDGTARKALYVVGLLACAGLAAALPAAAIRSGAMAAAAGLALYPLRRLWKTGR